MKTSSFAAVALLFATSALADAQEMPSLIQSDESETNFDALKFLNDNDMIDLFEGPEASEIISAMAEHQSALTSEHAMLQTNKYDDRKGKNDSDDDSDGYMYCSDDEDKDGKNKYSNDGKREKYCRKQDADTGDYVNVAIGGVFIAGIFTWGAIANC